MITELLGLSIDTWAGIIVAVVIGVPTLYYGRRQFDKARASEAREIDMRAAAAAKAASFSVAAALHPDGLPDQVEFAPLLSWRCRFVPDIVGEKAREELASLIDWVKHGPDSPSVRILAGSGGAGKTRLGCELVRALAQSHFRCRDDDGSLEKGHRRLWIIDYPEEADDLIKQRIIEAREWPGGRGRVLLLTRIPTSSWVNRLPLATGILMRQTRALRYSTDDAEQLFWAIRRRLLECYGDQRTLLERLQRREIVPDDVRRWIHLDPQEHVLPVNVFAVAIHSVLEPNQPLKLIGAELTEYLGERERARLTRFSKAAGFQPEAASRLAALAAVAGDLPIETIEKLAVKELQIGLTGDPDTVVDRIRSLPWWDDERSRWVAPKPHAVAAALAYDVLHSRSDKAAAWIRVALGHADRDATMRVARITHDIATVFDARPREAMV